MKRNLIFTALGAMLLASCADTWDRVYENGNPQKEGYEYLAEYAPLKENVDRSKYPNFKVGLALAAADYNKQELVYALANSNFDEIVAGNAMKMASCVNDKGEMSFTTVSDFVNYAANAGMNVYGHTLAWHSQQPVKWLGSLLADKELPPSEGEGSCLHINTSEAKANPWDWQLIYDLDGTTLAGGKSYKLTMKIKASDAVAFPLWIETPGAGNTHYGLPQVTAGKTWGTIVLEFTPNSDCTRLLFSFGQFGGDLYFDDIVLTEAGSDVNMIENGDFESDMVPQWSKPGWHAYTYAIENTPGDSAVEIFTDIISNGDAEGGESANIVSTHIGGQNGPCDVVAGAGVNGSNAFVVTSAGGGVNSWDTQIFVYANRALKADDVVLLSFDYRADAPNNSESQTHSTPGGYLHWDGGCAVNFTTEWQHFEKKMTINSTMSPEGNMQTFAWNLDVGVPNAPANKYYFDNVKFQIITSGNTIPLTPEEKKDTLTWAMDKWIGGMMETCKDKVKAWDVVNEAISGGNPDSEGVFALQHSQGYTLGGTWDVGGDAFYWQDYMGDIDYVRTAVALARKHYEANGGTSADLKLFVNDYNLESDWDDNGKVKSLIKWIERWEADGVTKIDGIGTQMHISCYMNPQTQESKKKHITKMFELIAASGKLCRVSELDMGLVDANGNTVSTANVTEEQHKAMAEMYKFVVSEYLRIIPVAQQWGICQWCATDSPAGSGWRANEPVGLWDSNYYRKHTYAGFADGLSGK